MSKIQYPKSPSPRAHPPTSRSAEKKTKLVVRKAILLENLMHQNNYKECLEEIKRYKQHKQISLRKFIYGGNVENMGMNHVLGNL
jgi:hypothetical protein